MAERAFPDMFIDPEDDPREQNVVRLGDERSTLIEYVRYQRLTLELKCSGLDAADLARRSVEPSTMSLLGIVRHMAEVERKWFRVRMAGLDVGELFRTADDRDAEWTGAAPDPAVVEEAWRLWRAEKAFTDQFVSEAPNLDVVNTRENPGFISLRELMVHMVEEYARHNGHADLLRERIDGRTGE